MYKLYLDESGKPTLANIDPAGAIFSFGGVLVHDGAGDFIRSRGGQIRFKYWGPKATTVFHGYPIRRNREEFAIFARNTTRREEFHNDLIQYIQSAQFKFIWVGVNKIEWLRENPPIAHAVAEAAKLSPKQQRKALKPYEVALTQKILDEVFRIYLCHLFQKNDYGQVIVEAADRYQDQDILAVYNKFLSSGYGNWGAKEVREHLTCVSFVTKKNRDAETQLADLGTLFLNLDARKNDGVLTSANNHTDFDDIMAKSFKNKSFFVKQDGAGKIPSFRKLC